MVVNIHISEEFETYLTSKVIFHELSVPYSSEQKGVAERMNHSVIKSVRSMLSHAGLSNRFWAEAVATAAYIRKHLPTSIIEGNTTP